MSHRPDGRRGRGRKTDPAEETATWLLEMEQQAEAEGKDEEDWAQQLRSTRAASGSTGQFPAVPVDGPGDGGPPSASRGAPPGVLPGVSPGAPSAPPVSPGGAPLGEYGNAGTAPVHPPLAERYRPTGGLPPRSAATSPPPSPPVTPTPPPPSRPPPPPVATTDPAAAAWSWETGTSSADYGVGTGAGAYAPPPAWEPGVQAQPQAPPDPRLDSRLDPGLDPRLAAPAPWESDDAAFTAPTQEPQPWDTAADPEQWGGAWPFEDSTHSWEPDDRSWPWPTQEAPPNTGGWEAADPSVWHEDRRGTSSGQPGQPAAYQSDQWTATPGATGLPAAAAAPHPDPAAWAPGETSGRIYGHPDLDDLSAPGGAVQGSGYSTGPIGAGPAASGAGAAGAASAAAAAGADPAYGYATPSPTPGYPGVAPQDLQGFQWSQGFQEAQGITPGGGASAGSQAWAGGSGSQASWADPPAQTWYEDEPSRPYEAAPSERTSMVGDDEEQVVRLGRAVDDPDGRGFGVMDGARVQPGRSLRTGEAHRLQPTGGYRQRRSNWPRVVALISWIVLLMVVCWFYVFPWLERILPENF